MLAAKASRQTATVVAFWFSEGWHLRQICFVNASVKDGVETSPAVHERGGRRAEGDALHSHCNPPVLWHCGVDTVTSDPLLPHTAHSSMALGAGHTTMGQLQNRFFRWTPATSTAPASSTLSLVQDRSTTSPGQRFRRVIGTASTGPVCPAAPALANLPNIVWHVCATPSPSLTPTPATPSMTTQLMTRPDEATRL